MESSIARTKSTLRSESDAETAHMQTDSTYKVNHTYVQSQNGDYVYM